MLTYLLASFAETIQDYTLVFVLLCVVAFLILANAIVLIYLTVKANSKQTVTVTVPAETENAENTANTYDKKNA